MITYVLYFNVFQRCLEANNHETYGCTLEIRKHSTQQFSGSRLNTSGVNVDQIFLDGLKFEVKCIRSHSRHLGNSQPLEVHSLIIHRKIENMHPKTEPQNSTPYM